MTDYSAHDIHLLDQSYPDALNSIEHLTGDPAHKHRLTEVGAEVFAAELTRELAATFDKPLSLAGWAAIATVRLMEAGKTWEEDTDAAWAKVDAAGRRVSTALKKVEGLLEYLGEFGPGHPGLSGLEVRNLTLDLTAIRDDLTGEVA